MEPSEKVQCKRDLKNVRELAMYISEERAFRQRE